MTFSNDNSSNNLIEDKIIFNIGNQPNFETEDGISHVKDLNESSAYQISKVTNPPNLHIKNPSNSHPVTIIPSMEQTMITRGVLGCDEKFPETSIKCATQKAKQEELFHRTNTFDES